MPYPYRDPLLDPNRTTKEDFECLKDYKLFIAVAEGQPNNFIQNLIAQGANPHAAHKRCHVSAIHTAIHEKESDEVAYLRLKSLLGDESQFPSTSDTYSQGNTHTPVCLAIDQAKLKCIEFLIQRDAQFTSCKRKDCEGPLVNAVHLNSRNSAFEKAHPLVKGLLSHPKTHQFTTDDYNNAFLALTQGTASFPTEGFLSYVSGPAMSLYSKNTKEMAELLLAKLDGNPNIPDDETGNTAFYYAVLCQPLLIQYLIDQGANINHQNKQGNTALHSLCFFMDGIRTFPELRDEWVARVLTLIQKGADMKIKNQEGKTSLEELPSQQRESVLNQYLEKTIQCWRLNQPIDRHGRLLDQDAQRAVAYFLQNQLSEQGRSDLCRHLGVKNPEQIEQPSGMYQTAQSYLTAFWRHAPENTIPSEKFTDTILDEAERKALMQCFENSLVEKNYNFLGIAEEKQAELKLTQEGVFGYLITILPNTLEQSQSSQIAPEAPRLR